MLYISGLTELLRKEEENEEERLRLLNESVESLVNYHPTLFRNGRDTCTLTALNTTTYDIFESSNSVLNVSIFDAISLFIKQFFLIPNYYRF